MSTITPSLYRRLTKSSLHTFLFFVILAEGYVVLSTELVAIRLLIPFVGNGTETLSILIASVLLPLSVGYYVGGQYGFRSSHAPSQRKCVRQKLSRNLCHATIILAVGLSYVILVFFFSGLESLGITNRMAETIVYAGIFIVYPVFLLGQTVPLISHYFRRHNLATATGHMLFFSTVGSFFGSIVSTMVLMVTIGVHYTALINVLILMVLAIVFNKKKLDIKTASLGLAVVLAICLNNHYVFHQIGVVENNQYNTIYVTPVSGDKDARVLSINHSLSSKYSPKFSAMFPYIKYIEKNFIRALSPEKSILVIGAGGFTLGMIDTQHPYTFVDIDPNLKNISEAYFLKRKIGPNKKFVVMPARAFLRQSHKHYDLIVVDAYSNIATIPPQLITQEFFESLKQALSSQGVLVLNAIVSANFHDRYSRVLDHTFREVFHQYNRQVIGSFDAWKRSETRNVIYAYFRNRNHVSDIYTDDHNAYFIDRMLS